MSDEVDDFLRLLLSSAIEEPRFEVRSLSQLRFIEETRIWPPLYVTEPIPDEVFLALLKEVPRVP